MAGKPKPVPKPTAPKWAGFSAPGLVARVVLVALALVYYLVITDEAVDHGEDFLPQWTLARLAVQGRGPAAYDYAAQMALLRSELPAQKLEYLNSPHIVDVGVCPYPPVQAVVYAP